jgi:DNA-binding transcriptional MocR family regulator
LIAHYGNQRNAFQYDILVFRYIQMFQNVVRQLVETACSLEFLVVCDDVYNLLYYGNAPHPPKRIFAYDASLERYAGGHVISNCSFSKIMTPAVRVGWLEVSARHAQVFRAS